jgi:hypothetical protein
MKREYVLALFGLVFGLLFGSLARADLFCAPAFQGAPTELGQRFVEPYRVLQIDGMNDTGLLQLTLEDNYADGSRVYNLQWMYRADTQTIRNIKLGDYASLTEPGRPAATISITEQGRVHFTESNWDYVCEIPGGYQESYTAEVK